MAKHLYMFLIAVMLFAATSAFAALPTYEFTSQADVNTWTGQHSISSKLYVNGSMELTLSGEDPYITGPARNLGDKPVYATIRIYSEVGGPAEFFWYTATQGVQAGHEVAFVVPAGQWSEIAVSLPALGSSGGLRLDPPGTSGKCLVNWVHFDEQVIVNPPAWAGPTMSTPAPDWLIVTSGNTSLTHDPTHFGRFYVNVNGVQTAAGWDQPWLCFRSTTNAPVWLNLLEGAHTVQAIPNGIQSRLMALDTDGAVWTLTNTFTPGTVSGTIACASTIRVNQARRAWFVPWMVMFPKEREHALFPGLEYMDPLDTSSSKDDIETWDYQRRAPDPEKMTFPMLAMQAQNRWIGLSWVDNNRCQPVFDGPDRVFSSNLNFMGVLASNFNSNQRDPGSLLPAFAEEFPANTDITLNMNISGGNGPNMVPAIQTYVKLYGMPQLPDPGRDMQNYITWTAGGWLDSNIRSGDLYRHATWPGANNWAPAPVGDVPWMERWLAENTTNPTLKTRLQSASEGAAAQVIAAGSVNFRGVAHVQYPIASLIFTDGLSGPDIALGSGNGQYAQFTPEGTVLYNPPATGNDLSRTHWAKHANGMTAAVLKNVWDGVLYSADPTLGQKALTITDMLSQYDNEAPRGAQTWEVPLHTPDILGSAYLVYSNLAAYEYTGKKQYLDKAIDWAWTGVPFVYLVNPTAGAIGPYATIPVFGSTQFTLMNWMGVPVQWCGMVYADAIRRLQRFDPTGPWEMLWKGITISGIQQSFPTGPDATLQATLPDSVNLRAQTRNGVAINPGTVMSCATNYYLGIPAYDYRIYRSLGLMVHLPGQWLPGETVMKDELTFRAQLWTDAKIMVVGLKRFGAVLVDGLIVPIGQGASYDPNGHLFVNATKGMHTITIKLNAQPPPTNPAGGISVLQRNK
ncbi:MAG: hypothetical protein ACYC1M_19310 [Armatimonadota bacterium]